LKALFIIWRNKWIRITLILFLILAIIYVARFPILKSIGNFLVVNDIPKKSDVIFVLSGSAFDRGTKAAELFSNKFADKIICTGGNKDGTMLALGKEMYECEITKSAVELYTTDSIAIDTLKRGTSTYEESKYILQYCLTHQIKSCIIVTSSFHTRRVSWVFNKTFKSKGVDLIFVAADSQTFNSQNWWQSEQGLIQLNNEYIKILYYLVKY
jgi:uncharacterized SAM-binding protein YcdF (DUF218 family)